MTTLEKAIAIASNAHAGQVDKGGKPYILHPVRVMMAQQSIDAMIVGVLHDVVEDTTISLEELTKLGFSNEVVEAINCLTKKGKNYDMYLQKVKQNSLAREVKLADLADNMDLSRLPTVTEKDLKRQQKYLKASEYLQI